MNENKNSLLKEYLKNNVIQNSKINSYFINLIL